MLVNNEQAMLVRTRVIQAKLKLFVKDHNFCQLVQMLTRNITTAVDVAFALKDTAFGKRFVAKAK